MEKLLSPRFMFGFDILLLSSHLDSYTEKDPRNDRAAKLIDKAAKIYIGGGQKYVDMLNDVGENAFQEYYNWYDKNITRVVIEAQKTDNHVYSNGVPECDVNKYGLSVYFDGLNKDVFEEIQKLIIFLYDKRSIKALDSLSEEFGNDPDFTEQTHGFVILAHSILISCLEGGEFLDRLEKIFSEYQVDANSITEEIINSFEEFKKSRTTDIDEIAYNFINRKYPV